MKLEVIDSAAVLDLVINAHDTAGYRQLPCALLFLAPSAAAYGQVGHDHSFLLIA